MLILTEAQLNECADDLRQSPLVDHDTETTGLFAFNKVGNTSDPGNARIAGHAFLSGNTMNKYYIPIRHETVMETNITYSIPPKTTESVFDNLFENSRRALLNVLEANFIDVTCTLTGFGKSKTAQSKRQNVKIKILTEVYLYDYDYNIEKVVHETLDPLINALAQDNTQEGTEWEIKSNETNIYEGCVSKRSHEIKNLDVSHVNTVIQPVFEDESKTLVGFNYKFDLSVMRFDDLIPSSYIQDVMLLCHMNQENEYNYRLKDLGVKYIDPDAKDQQDFVKEYMKKWKLKRYSQVPADIMGEYAEQDVYLTHKLYEKVTADIAEQNFTNTSVKDIDKNLVYKESQFLRLLDKVWYNGIPIDPNKCLEAIKEADIRSEELAFKAEQYTGFPVNLNSSAQLAKVLGIKSTAKDVLETMKTKTPLAEYALEYRAWQKVKGTYYEVFLRDRDENNKLHPDLFQIGTVTGRLSCRNPNFQALPRAKDDNDPFVHIYKVRNVVVPPGPDYALVFSDLSQAEMRIASYYAKELNMIEIIKAGGDLHTQTAVAMFGEKCIDPKTGKPTKEYRNYAKRLNFGIIYGMGAAALAGQLGCTMEHAMELLNQYHKKFPGFKKLYAKAETLAIARGFIKMWTGRLRRFRGDTVELWECRKAMNNLIQGSVSEMMKHAMLKVDELLTRETGNRSYIFNQVHDDLQMVIHKDDWHLIPQIRDIMQDNSWMYTDIITGAPKDPQYAVPIITDTEYSLTSWGEKNKWVEGVNPWN